MTTADALLVWFVILAIGTVFCLVAAYLLDQFEKGADDH
jgi:hypothetical protein